MAEREHTEHTPRRRSKSGEASVIRPIPKHEELTLGITRAGSETPPRSQAPADNNVANASTKSAAAAGNEAMATATALLGGRKVIGVALESDLDVHEMLRRGLPRAALGRLVANLHVIGVGEASEAFGVSLRTLQRHKLAPVMRLNSEQSARTWKFAEVLAKATRVLGSQDEAEQWLRRPAIGLDQRRPVDLLTTPAGAKLVEDYLGRLEYDVYT